MMRLFLLLLLVTSIRLHAQSTMKYTTNLVVADQDNAPGFYISDRPITNREYLTYLIWTMNTYQNYPYTVIEALPGTQEANGGLFTDQFIFSEHPLYYYTERAPEIVRNYMFNPRYIDYPVVGLTWQQAMRFCKWLSDRYNEYNLIKKGYLKFNPDQIDYDCFVTESFLYRQYEGYAKKENTITWCDGILIPAFRLPIQSELEDAKKEIGIEDEIKAYSPGVNPFLKLWTDLYLAVNDTALLLYERLYETENPAVFLKSEQELDRESISGTELTLDDEDQYNFDYRYVLISKGYNFRAPDHYRDVEFFFNEKDSLGQMPFIIIDEYDSGTPMAIEQFHFIKSPDTISVNTSISRYTLNKR